MIKSFRHKGLKLFWERQSRKRIPDALVPRVERMLDALDAATDPLQLNLPGFNLHRLKGSRQGEWSIWASGNWRITFRFEAGDAYDVNLEDYH